MGIVTMQASSIYAVRGVIEFSFDGERWYKEGDRVNIVADAQCYEEALIVGISEMGEMTAVHDSVENTFLLRNIMIEGIDDDRGYQSGEIVAYRERREFTLDFLNWFSSGQTCFIRVEDEVFINCRIVNFLDNGKILIDDNGHQKMLHYEQIFEIWDESNKVYYLVPEIKAQIS